MKISVLGAGAWGTALACIAARGNHKTVLWGRNRKTIAEITTRGTNRDYLGDLPLEPKIHVTHDLEEGVSGTDCILLAIPAQQLAAFLGTMPSVAPEIVLIGCAKGMERTTNRLPSQIIASAFPQNPIAALSGPSFAHDVVRGMPTAVTLASADAKTADRWAHALSNDSFRCYSSTDITGVELGGALKNIMAIAVGIAHGMELGASAKAALITRGFAELSRLAATLGSRQQTLMGLSGMGDLVLTCSSTQSRNFAYGVAIGTASLNKDMKLAEGAFTASVALALAKDHQIEIPIIEAVNALLDGTIEPQAALSRLLTRPLKRETE